MRLHPLACLVAVALTGCSSITRHLTFTGVEGSAFALVVADGMAVNGSEGYTFVFQKVDRENASFLPERFSVNFSGMGTMEGDEFKKPQGLQTTLRFGGTQVPAGSYALVSRIDHRALGYVQNTNVNCFSAAARVFGIGEGFINVIALGDVRSRTPVDKATLQAQLALVLSAYPNMTAPRQVAEVVGTLSFETSKGVLGGETCNRSGPIDFRPAPT